MWSPFCWFRCNKLGARTLLCLAHLPQLQVASEDAVAQKNVKMKEQQRAWSHTHCAAHSGAATFPFSLFRVESLLKLQPSLFTKPTCIHAEALGSVPVTCKKEREKGGLGAVPPAFKVQSPQLEQLDGQVPAGGWSMARTQGNQTHQSKIFLCKGATQGGDIGFEICSN